MQPYGTAGLSPLGARSPVGRQNARKLSHLIARELRGMIIRGELVPEQVLPSEGDLLRAFDVSRDTLREALRILESESLIVVRRGRRGGAVVERPHRRSITRHVALLLQTRGAMVSELHEAQLAIEPLAAARVADVGFDAARKLADLHDAELQHLEDPSSFVSAHAAFDNAVFELSGNETIALLSSVIRDLIAGQAYLGGSPDQRSSTFESLTELHGAFVDAVTQQDARRAHDAWVEFLTETAKLMMQETGDTKFQIAPLWRALRQVDGMGSGPDKMAASIATDVRIRIAEGQLRPGDQLPALPVLAAEFGVSRPTIRECLRVLEVEGLVDLRAGSRNGATVLEPAADTAGRLAGVVLAAAQTRMTDVVEARRLIEPSVAELVAARIVPPELAALSSRIGALSQIVEDTPTFIDAFMDLESDMFSAAQNPAISVATAVINWVSVRCRRDVKIRALGYPRIVTSNRRSCASLAEFVGAAERRDVERAARAWAEHLDEIAPFYRSSFGDRLIGDLFD